MGGCAGFGPPSEASRSPAVWVSGGPATERWLPHPALVVVRVNVIYAGGMVVPAPSTAPAVTSRGTYFRLGLAVVWMLILAAAVLSGERQASMDDFDGAVAAGRVHAVRLVGELSSGMSGASLVELHWRDRLFARVSQVRQVRSDVPVAGGSSSDRIVVGDLAGQLSSAHPGLQVISDPSAVYRSGLGGVVLGWQVFGWIAAAVLVAWLATAAFLINGPEPWRATRWAWFWAIANPLGVVGCFAFLLLSGPTPMLPASTKDSRRLHGGWAFLIATAATGTWRS